MRFFLEADLVKREHIKKDVMKITIYYDGFALFFEPGHLIEIYFSDDDDQEVIRKNLNVYSIDKENSTIDIVFKIEDRPTRLLEKVIVGEKLFVFGPVGMGTFIFDETKHKKVMLVGSGAGIFALHSLAEKICGKAKMVVYMGFKSNQDVILVEDFAKLADRVIVTTEDKPIETRKNIIGMRGKVSEIVRQNYDMEKPKIIYTSGSIKMIRNLRRYIYDRKSACQVSFQDVVRFTEGDNAGFVLKQLREFEDVYPSVWEDGPVFSLHGLTFDEKEVEKK